MKRNGTDIDAFIKRNRILFLFLCIVIFAILTVTAVTILKNGNHYTLKYEYFYTDVKIYDENIETSCTDEGVVEIKRAYVDKNNTVCVELEAISPGRTGVKTVVYYLDAETGEVYAHPMIEYPIRVLDNGMILETDHINFNGYKSLQNIILLCLLMVSLFMLVMFIECIIKSFFSYSMVMYGGLFLYILAIVVYTKYYINNGVAFRSFRSFLDSINYTGFYFPLVAAIPMLLIAFLIAFSNIWLIRHEGFRPVNTLGIIFGILLFAGNVIVYVAPGMFNSYNSEFGDTISAINMSFAYLLSFMEILFLFIMVTAILSTVKKPPYDRDYIIILGCRIKSDGTPTPLLKGRVDAAISFEKEQYEKTGKHAKFVPSGGQGSDEVMSESESMKNYLISQGIPENMILTEDKSTNTLENIRFSKAVIEADAKDAKTVKTAFSTTNYHVFRGYTLSQDNGLDARGISAKTKLYFYPNAFLREFVGLLFAKKYSIGLTAAVIMTVSAVVFMLI